MVLWRDPPLSPILDAHMVLGVSAQQPVSNTAVRPHTVAHFGSRDLVKDGTSSRRGPDAAAYDLRSDPLRSTVTRDMNPNVSFIPGENVRLAAQPSRKIPRRSDKDYVLTNMLQYQVFSAFYTLYHTHLSRIPQLHQAHSVERRFLVGRFHSIPLRHCILLEPRI